MMMVLLAIGCAVVVFLGLIALAAIAAVGEESRRGYTAEEEYEREDWTT